MTIRTPWSTGFRLLLVIALFALTGGASLAYQGDIKDALQEEDEGEFPGLVEEGEYVSPQFGVEVTWSDAWAVGDRADPNVEHAIGGNYEGPVASDPDLGDIVFLVDTESESSVLSLGFSPNEEPVEPERLLQAMGQETFLEENLFLSDEAEVLLLEANRSTAAILAREATPNDDHVVYLSIVADPGRQDYSFWVGLDVYEPDEYEDILTSMQEDIEVEDNDIFDVFGPEEILAAIEASDAEPTEEPAETEEATEEPTETIEATEEPAETVEATEEVVIPPFELTETPERRDGATPESTEPAQATPESSPQASPAASSELPGLVAEGDYISPQHDVPVEWNEAWTLAPDTDQPVQSFPETGVDALYLTDTAAGNAIVYITIEDAGGEFDPDTAVDALSSPDYIESRLQLSPETEVVLSDAGPDSLAIMYLDSSGAAPVVVTLEAHVVDDDTIIFVEVRADADDIDAGLLDSVADDIAVNEEAALRVFSTDEILDALP